MNKAKIKESIKPLVKECIMEILVEEKLLKEIVSQVAGGMQTRQVVVERKQEYVQEQPKKVSQPKHNISDLRKKMMEAIGKDAYNGVNLFENTVPLRESGTPGVNTQENLLGDDPSDAGVDISNLIGDSSKIFKLMKK